MKAKGTKFISLFLVFSLVTLIAPIVAKERRGIELEILKTDTQRIRGELIAVKENSLLLLDSKGADIAVALSDVVVIKIVKKSKAHLWGFLIGAGSGAILGSKFTWPESNKKLTVVGGVIFGAIGLLVGGIIRSVAGKDEIIRLDVKSPEEVKRILEELRSKARIPDYN